MTRAIDRYSYYVLDLDTTNCFFAHQEIKQGLRKIAYPIVNLRSSTEPTQSESQNALRVKDPLLKKRL